MFIRIPTTAITFTSVALAIWWSSSVLSSTDGTTRSDPV